MIRIDYFTQTINILVLFLVCKIGLKRLWFTTDGLRQAVYDRWFTTSCLQQVACDIWFTTGVI